MHITYLCDRCLGRINKDDPYNVKIVTRESEHSLVTTQYDLCPSCADEIRDKVKIFIDTYNGEE